MGSQLFGRYPGPQQTAPDVTENAEIIYEGANEKEAEELIDKPHLLQAIPPSFSGEKMQARVSELRIALEAQTLRLSKSEEKVTGGMICSACAHAIPSSPRKEHALVSFTLIIGKSCVLAHDVF